MRWILLAMTIPALAGWFAWRHWSSFDTSHLAYVDGRLVNERISRLHANTWVEIASDRPGWTRQGHAGMAFDSKRGTLLVFGSDTHGENWDNSVHEFNPVTLRWITHQPASPPSSYRVDGTGQPVAGDGGRFPWAMHTFDNIVYSAKLDALVVTSKIDHTPAPPSAASPVRSNPTWIYSLETRQWEIPRSTTPANPSFFAAGSTYDPVSGNVAAYQHGGLWWLDAAAREWRRAPGTHGTDLGIHFMMLTDTQRRQLVLFGSRSGAIWVYDIPTLPAQVGRWEKKQPGGDSCLQDEHFPVAYDSHQGVFLLLPDENEKRSVTLAYLPSENRCIRLTGAEMPPQRMNYMLEYDPYHRVFLLVTGDWRSPVSVWAFRLDLNAAAQGAAREAASRS